MGRHSVGNSHIYALNQPTEGLRKDTVGQLIPAAILVYQTKTVVYQTKAVPAIADHSGVHILASSIPQAVSKDGLTGSSAILQKGCS